MGTGLPDLYKAFVWRFWSLLNEGTGRMSVVLPRSVLASKGAADFRKAVFQSGVVGDLTILLNSGGWVFDDAEHRYTIALVSIEKKEPVSNTSLPVRGPWSSQVNYEMGMRNEAIRFELVDVLSWTATAALPLLPDECAAEAFAQLRKAPNLDLDGKMSWRARPYFELNATNDKKFMEVTNHPDKSWWPVYKGASFDIWEPDTGKYYAWAIPEKMLKRLLSKRIRGNRNRRSAFSEFSKEWASDESSYPALRPRIAFRDVARATDQRTVRIALIPPNVVAQDKAPTLLWPRGDERDEAYLLGVMSSIPLDWYARRFVEVNMGFHILNALPVPRPPREGPALAAGGGALRPPGRA